MQTGRPDREEGEAALMAMGDEQTLGSANLIVSSYFQFARETAAALRGDALGHREQAMIAVGIIIVVSAVEAYLNVAGRLRVEQDPRFEHGDRIRKDLEERVPLREKLKKWPMLLFGKRLDFSQGPGQEFLALLDRRHGLLHFPPSYESATVGNVTLRGLQDVTTFTSLRPGHLTRAHDTAEGMIAELIRPQGLSEERVLLATTHWTGRPPFPDELERARAADRS